ncbi:hypothetical protein Tco_0823191 [Tanacetum coccineum]|uniref:Uncharacterized protein n=1 Tax=Tanacetum coccineum TaxID=301880 RepID=A0ABQ5AKI9_9ASTR
MVCSGNDGCSCAALVRCVYWLNLLVICSWFMLVGFVVPTGSVSVYAVMSPDLGFNRGRMCNKSGKEPYWKILRRYVILQLALEFGIVTELVLLKTPYERRPCTGKRTQGPFSWGPAVGGEGVCTRLTLPNVEISWPLLGESVKELRMTEVYRSKNQSYRAKKLIGGSELRYSWIISCVCGKPSAIEDTRESKGQTWPKSIVGSAEYL